MSQNTEAAMTTPTLTAEAVIERAKDRDMTVLIRTPDNGWKFVRRSKIGEHVVGRIFQFYGVREHVDAALASGARFEELFREAE